MKIVLRESIENLGTAGEIVEVKGGYARNFLLPKGFAMAATPANLKLVEINRKREDARHSRLHDDAEALAQQITATPLDLAHRAGDTETIYGAVTAAEIAFALGEKGIEVDHRKIQLEKPIKTLGTFEVPIKLHHDVTTHVIVNIIREEV